MISSPSAAFTTEEAKLRGAAPIALFSFLPFYHGAGIDGGGTFLESSYVAPDKILATYEGFASGYWISEIMSANLGRYPSPAVLSLDYNTPGYTMTFYWRSAPTSARVSASSWTALAPGDTVQVYAYYQWKVAWAGYRCWAQDPGDAEDDFTAWAEDDPGSGYDSYAADTEHEFDSQAYIQAVLWTGEYPVAKGDVVDAGNLIQEVSKDFTGLVAGTHTLVLNNRHGFFSPLKSSFIFAGEDWFRRQVRIDFGYVKPGSHGQVTDTITLYLGEIRRWGPVQRGTRQAHTVEIYSKDFISQLLEKPIGLIDSDGNKQVLIYGERLAKADKINGKALVPPLRTANFEKNNFNELDSSVSSGGGAISIISSSPLAGSYSMRSTITGASQSAYGTISLPTNSAELFAKFKVRFQTVPGAPADLNYDFLQIKNSAGTIHLRLQVTSTGKVKATYQGGSQETDMAVASYEGIRADMAVWVKCATAGSIYLWINGDQALSIDDIDLSAFTVKTILLGGITGGSAESWTIDFDDIEVGDKYHDQAYQVPGYPFTEIKTVYVDEAARSSNLEKFPTLGAVNFTDSANKVSGEVMARVVKNTTTHAVDQIEAVLIEAGLSAYINAASFAAAKAAVPDDLVGSYFDGGSYADALLAINERCLYFLFVDHGEIFIIPYDGTPPASAVLAFTNQELREFTQVIDSDETQQGVNVKWGWQDHNPDLVYQAGTPSDQGAEIDLTWGAPVATEQPAMAQSKADLLFKRLDKGQEIGDPVRGTHRMARLELLDNVSVYDPHLLDAARYYSVARKEMALGRPAEINLRLLRFLGES